MRRLLLALLVASLAAALFAQEYKLGAKVGDFTVYDLKGTPVNASTLRGGLTVILFIATACPVSNAYNERMKAVYNDYAGKGVKFVAINSNNTEPAPEVEKHAAAHQFPFRVYKDIDNVVADRFGAQVTPEVFVLDETGVVRYHGSIDDSRDESKINTRGLRWALDALFAGKPVEKTETKAFGCTIRRVKKTS